MADSPTPLDRLGPWQRLQQAPLFCCGFRPFFLAASIWAGLAILTWVAMWGGLIWMPQTPLPGPLWHAHEMLWGFAIAAVAGFLLTAAPEFTRTADFSRSDTLGLFTLWLLARWLGLIGPTGALATAWTALAATANLALVVWLLLRVTPRLWGQESRPHFGFVIAMATLLLLEGGFWTAQLRAGWAMPWLNAQVGLLMILIVLALSRISTRLMHGMLDALGIHEKDYRAPPPRRRLAITCIALVTVAEQAGLAPSTLGWLALAATASMLALLTEWHLGRSLLHRWIWPAYAVYASIALGYAMLGLTWLGLLPWSASAGRHLLTVGGMGMAILVVFSVAGRIHAGRDLDDRPWRLIAVSLLLIAALTRMLAGTPWLGSQTNAALWLAALAWSLAWLLFVIYAWSHLTGPRLDGHSGCEEAE